MNLKLTIIISLCLLMFILGFSVGGVHWEWADKKYEGNVAFWAMVGGWVSSVATLAAVVFSMYMAHQTSQNGMERLSLKLGSYSGSYGETNDCTNLEVKNMRSITAVINKVLISVHGCDVTVDISFLKQGGDPIPYVLYQVGEKWEFAFYLADHVKMASVFTTLKMHGNPTFKSGFILVETAMSAYKVKLPDEFLASFKHKYEIFNSLK